MPIYRHPLCTTAGAPELGDLPLDTALIRRLEASFRAMEFQGPVLADIFFRLAAERTPARRALGLSSPAEEGRKFMSLLAFLVGNLRSPELVTRSVRELGGRLRRYGVRPEQLPMLLGALLAAMAETLGPAWTPEARADWTEALRLAGGLMREGATAPPGSMPG